MAKASPIAWTHNRGRNGFDPVLDLSLEETAESRNVLLYGGGLGTKRGGSTAITEAGLTGHNALFEYLPGQDPTAAELFVVDNSGPIKILRGNTGTGSAAITWTNMTIIDQVVVTPWTTRAVTLNGKLYFAFGSGVNRLHVFDPGLSVTTVRRAGMGTPAAPTVANSAVAGAYPATLRYYKVAYTEQRGGVTVRRSELSPKVSFTPDGAHTNATVTKPAAISESETHWELYGSADDTTYYLLATTVVGTTTYADTATPSTYNTNTAQPTTGANTPFPSVRYLGTDGNRLLGFGVYETSAGDSLPPKNGRVFFGPVLDSSGVQDDERINNTTALQGWIDLARNSGAVDRALTERPVNNVFYAFQSVGVYGLFPTENATTPYRRVIVSTAVGAINQQSTIVAEDGTGAVCAYFLDITKGPYTVGGPHGLRWCGKDVKDVWSTVNKDATIVAAHAVWYPDRHVVLFWVATGSSNTPDTILALDVTKQALDESGDLRGGWTVWKGDFAAASCSVMFSNTVAATRSRNRVPYVGLTIGTNLYRYDESKTDDNGVAFQAFVTSSVLAQSTKAMAVLRSYVRASAKAAVTIQQAYIRNFGDEANRTATVLLTPVGSQTGVLRMFETPELQDADAIQVTLGDVSAVASTWQLLAWHSQDLTLGAAVNELS